MAKRGSNTTTVGKVELARRVAENLRQRPKNEKTMFLTAGAVLNVIDAMGEEVMRAVVDQNEEVLVAGLGKIELLRRKPKAVTNIRTGQRMLVPSVLRLVLRNADKLKKRLKEKAQGESAA